MLRLAQYGLTLPNSHTTARSWAIKVGCKFDRAKRSYYTDGHGRSDIVEHRGRYFREKHRLALRQPNWILVEWESLHTEEKAKFESFLEEDTNECPAEAFTFEQDGVKWLEFHVDFLGGDSNDKNDELRKALGPEGGSFSLRFQTAGSAPCEYSHAPAVCGCRKQLYHMGHDESIYKACAREGREWVIRGVRGLR